MTRCGPLCDVDVDCPDGYLCSGYGHCGLDRCLDDSGCPEGMVCGVTESGRACVESGAAAIGEPCAASAECASAYCRAGVCEQSCASTGECPAGQECLADERAGYCADPECGGCAADEICRDGICDAAESCVEDADCGAVGVCVDGDCRRSCAVTADCDPEQTCIQGPPHIESLYCLDNDSGLVPCAGAEGEGCADGAWCSEWGTCQTGTPCRDWDASACEPDQLCVQNACVTPCASSGECEAGEECVGGYLGMAPTEEGEALVMSCEPATCNCPNADDVCITWTAGVQGECWSWEDCGATGSCDEGYGCDPAADGSPRCRCQDLEACGPRCVDDASCPENHVCDEATGRCVWDGCDDDGDCEAGEVCGLSDGSMQRACMEPGTRAPGAPCDSSSQCTTGVCFEGDCITVCTVTGDCEEGENGRSAAAHRRVRAASLRFGRRALHRR